MEVKSPPLHIGIIHPGDTGHIFATTHIRILQRMKQLSKHNLVNVFFFGCQYQYEREQIEQLKIDLVIVQRNAVALEHVHTLIDGLRQADIPIIYEIDDDLLSIDVEDPNHNYESHKEAIRILLQKANLVTVSTPKLKDRFASMNDSIAVVPNQLDDDLWFRHVDNVAKNVRESDEIKVLYMGSRTHDTDLALVEEAAKKIMAKYPKVQFHTMGGVKQQVTWLKTMPAYGHYKQFVSVFLHEAKKFDFAIAPLEQNHFTEGKSYIKFLDYSAVGLAGIYSRAGQYPEIIEDGVNGVLVENTTEAWYQALEDMIQHPDKRSAMAAKAYENVYNEHRISTSITDYYQLLCSAL